MGAAGQGATLSDIKLYLALSRTSHAVMDMWTPGLAALLWLGALPPLSVVALGILTCFAGYTAVYAVNDIVDRAVDREKLERSSEGGGEGYLDIVYVHHPIAHGLLPLMRAVFWAAAWALVAFVGAWHLNPVCALILLLGVALEAVYCRMLTISSWRIVVSGVVKTLGPLAAVFAVDPQPSPAFLLALFAWLFLWEVGGQNIPADWFDLEEDASFDLKTLPVRLGARRAAALVVASLLASLILNTILMVKTVDHFPPLTVLVVLAVGILLLLVPAIRAAQSTTAHDVARLFNYASLYPMVLFVVVLVSVLVRTVKTTA